MKTELKKCLLVVSGTLIMYSSFAQNKNFLSAEGKQKLEKAMNYDHHVFKINALKFLGRNMDVVCEKRVAPKVSALGRIDLDLSSGRQALAVHGGARYYYNFGKKLLDKKDESKTSFISGNYFEVDLALSSRFGIRFAEERSNGFYLTPSITTGIQRQVGKVCYFDGWIGYEFGRPNYSTLEYYRPFGGRSLKAGIAFGIYF